MSSLYSGIRGGGGEGGGKGGRRGGGKDSIGGERGEGSDEEGACRQPLMSLRFGEPVPLGSGETDEAVNVFFDRFLFSLGGFARFDNLIQSYFAFPFLVDIIGLGASLASLVLSLQKAIAALTDPIIGTLSDMTYSRYGRRKPYIFLGVIPLSALWLLRWLSIPMDFDQTYATIYYLVVLSSYSIARAMQEVPYRAMVPDVATTYKQRSQVAWMQVEATHCIGLFAVSIFMMVFWFQWSYSIASLTTFLFVGLPRFLFTLKVNERKVGFLYEGSDDHETIPASTRRYSHGGAYTESVSTRDMDNWDEYDDYMRGRGEEDKAPTNICEGITNYVTRMTLALRFRDIFYLSLCVFCLNLANVMHQSSLVPFLGIQFSDTELDESPRAAIAFAPLGEQLIGMVSQPLWLLIINYVGKKNAYFSSAFLLIVLLISLSLFPTSSKNYLGTIVLISLVGTSNSTSMIIQAMIPDTIRGYERFYNRRDEGFLVSVILFVAKMGNTLATVIVTYSFSQVDLEHKTTTSDTVSRCLCFAVPACLLLVSSMIMVFTVDYRDAGSDFGLLIPPESDEDGERERE